MLLKIPSFDIIFILYIRTCHYLKIPTFSFILVVFYFTISMLLSFNHLICAIDLFHDNLFRFITSINSRKRDIESSR